MAVKRETSSLASEINDFARLRLACIYDETRDVLFIFRLGAEKRAPAISSDVGGESWVRQDPVTGKIDAIEIEDFERNFLQKHPELRPHWIQAKEFVGEDNTPNRALLPRIVAILKNTEA